MKRSLVQQTGTDGVEGCLGSSCFNCLRSLADSLGLECVWPPLSLPHTPSLALCVSLALSDGRAARGKILRSRLAECRNPAKYHKSSVTVSTLFRSLTAFSLYLDYIFVWLTDSFDTKLFVCTRCVCVHMNLYRMYVCAIHRSTDITCSMRIKRSLYAHLKNIPLHVGSCLCDVFPLNFNINSTVVPLLLISSFFIIISVFLLHCTICVKGDVIRVFQLSWKFQLEQ